VGIVFIARHGESDWNREGRYQGRLESTLTELGRRQAEALADALAGTSVHRVISSPLHRTVETARPLAERLGLSIETDDRLIEIGHGSWEGLLREEIERDDPGRMRLWRTSPESVAFQDGESLTGVLERWRAFASALSKQPEAGHEERIAIVTHDALVRCAILDMLGRPLADFWQPRVVNCGYAQARFESGRRFLLDECCDAHLAGMIADTSTQAL
jgi:probable phosphoglycerate mutase